MDSNMEADIPFQKEEERLVESHEVSRIKSEDASTASPDDADYIFIRSDSASTQKRLTDSWLSKAKADFENFVASWNEPGQEAVIEAIQTLFLNSGDSDGVLKCLEVIAASIEGNAVGQKVLRDSGGLRGVCHFMGVHRADTAVQVVGCTLLKTTAEDSREVQDLIGSSEGIDSILDAMTTHRDNEAVQNAGASALRCLTWGEDNRKTMLRHGAIMDLVHALNSHPKSADLQEHVVCTIAHCVYKNEAGRKMSGKVGAVQAITKAMQNHPTVVSLQAQCCFALRNLSWQCSDIHHLMYAHNSHEAIMDAMIKNPRIPGLQDQALAALSNLMSNTKYASNRLIKTKDASQLIGILFAALRTFPTSTPIVRNSHLLLLTMCQLHTAIGCSLTQKQVLQFPSAAKIIIRSISSREHRSIHSARSASKLFQCLGSDDSFRVDVREHRGIEITLDSIDQFAESRTEDCVTLLTGLSVICSGNDDSKARFNNDAGGVLKISNLMAGQIESEPFQTACCMLLDNISNGQAEATAAHMANRDEAMNAVLPAMVLYLSSAELCEHACSMMIKVAATSLEDATRLYDAGAKPIVEKARSMHAGNPAVESLANQLLTLLVAPDDRSGRGNTPRGNASARLRSRSRTVQTHQRSRSRMDASKTPERKPRGGGLTAVDENSDEEGNALPAPVRPQGGGGKPAKRAPGAKPEGRKGRRGGGRVPISAMVKSNTTLE